MTFPALHTLRRALLLCAFAIASLLLQTPVRAASPTAQNLKVDINVTVHNSDIGVSQETLDDLVEKLLEEAGFKVDEAEADSASIQLKIDIYKDDNGGFKIVGDLDDPKDAEEDENQERTTDEQEQIDDMVTAIVQNFIKLLREP